MQAKQQVFFCLFFSTAHEQKDRLAQKQTEKKDKKQMEGRTDGDERQETGGRTDR